MKDFFKYLTSSDIDRRWGVYITVAGQYHAPIDQAYPSRDHPSGYYFDWQTGRTLDEYQLNYITEGQGVLETAAGKFNVEPGSIIVLTPGMAHRYKPDPSTGWKESYVGFKGELAKHFIDQLLITNSSPLITYGRRIELVDTFQKIFELVQAQKPGYQQIASAMVIKLLGYLVSFNKQVNLEGKEIEELVNSAKAYMWDHVSDQVDFYEFSKQNMVSYSHFRKTFKSYTGIAPHQYYLDLKIMRAKELVAATDKNIKEMTYELGFDSIHYFSKLFKKKTGFSPSAFRKNSRNE